MTNSNIENNSLTEVGKGLSAMYQWYTSSDIEALQVLLCIQLYADQNGYAQFVDVRREVGIAADRMTRCTRLLQGQKKSLSFISLNDEGRQPLIDITYYSDSPNVKRIALTPKGREIVNSVIAPVLSKGERIRELEIEVDAQKRIINSFKKIGVDPTSFKDHGHNQIYFDLCCQLIKASLLDLKAVRPEELKNISLPHVHEFLNSIEREDIESTYRVQGFIAAFMTSLIVD